MFFIDALRAAESLPEGTEESPPETLASTAGGEAVAAVVPAEETVDKRVTASNCSEIVSFPCSFLPVSLLLWVCPFVGVSLFFLLSLPSTTGIFTSKPTQKFIQNRNFLYIFNHI